MKKICAGKEEIGDYEDRESRTQVKIKFKSTETHAAFTLKIDGELIFRQT